ncbi:Heparan sulfate 2-O-sulfotransferase 1 [Nymphon striatum]|nr:Heparan sulfate 2-O-sulfotransferase 1 [Nymphon striatum]
MIYLDRDWVKRAADREDWRSRLRALLSSGPVQADDDDNFKIHILGITFLLFYSYFILHVNLKRFEIELHIKNVIIQVSLWIAEAEDKVMIALYMMASKAMSWLQPLSVFESTEPIYINLLRNPADRIISKFFYEAFSKYDPHNEYHADYTRIPDYGNIMKAITKDFFKCFKARNQKCAYIMNVSDTRGKLAIPYFCGHEAYCFVQGNRNALEKAKYVLDKKYTAVGVTDEYNMYLIVLEKLLPRYFNGVVKLYNDLNIKENVLKREDIYQEVKKELRANMTIEYELYEFAKQRLRRQYSLLNLNLIDVNVM